MTSLGRLALLLMIPINLLLVLWVWIGRIVFGVGGWFFVIFAFTVVPVLLIALLLTTILAYTQAGRPRSLTRTQWVAQVATWAGMLVFGASMPDFGDTTDSHLSLLTQVFGPGDAMLDLSYSIALGAAAVTVVAYVVLLLALVVGRQSRVPRPAGHAEAAATPRG